MTGWLIALGVLILLAIMPIGVSAVYNTDGAQVRVGIGPVRWTVYPTKKKRSSTKKEKEKTVQSGKKTKGKEPLEKGGSWTDFMPLIKTLLAFLGQLRRKVCVKYLRMNLILADADPCDLAIHYGSAWAALGNLMPHLENLFRIKKRDVQVQCDFTAQSTVIYARADISIPFARLLALVLRYGIRALVQYANITNKRKGGTQL